MSEDEFQLALMQGVFPDVQQKAEAPLSILGSFSWDVPLLG